MARRFEEYEDAESSKQSYLIGLLVSFIITGVICGLIILLEVFGMKRQFVADQAYLIWIDALTLSGGLVIAFYLLNVLSGEGVFDALAYSVKLVWYNTFYKRVRDTKLAPTYAAYREEKNRRKKRNMSFMLVGASPYFITGLILLIPFNILYM